jgi:hypothetical protein
VSRRGEVDPRVSFDLGSEDIQEINQVHLRGLWSRPLPPSFSTFEAYFARSSVYPNIDCFALDRMHEFKNFVVTMVPVAIVTTSTDPRYLTAVFTYFNVYIKVVRSRNSSVRKEEY